jgi:O-antigen ligase
METKSAADVSVPVLAVLFAGVLCIPLVVSVGGEDPFRLPKELALRAEVLALIVALAAGWAFPRLRLPRLDVRERWVTLAALLCGWTIVCALASTNRLVSVTPAVRVLEYALLFGATVLAIRPLGGWAAGLIVPAAAINGIVYMLQELELWTPFDTSAVPDKHLTHTAFLGNPNYAGSYLVAPAIVALALALSQRRYRIAWGAAALLLAAATVSTQTVGAIAALAVAMAMVLALRWMSWKKTAAALLAGGLAAGAAFAMSAPLRARAARMADAVKNRDYETLTSSRTMPFLAAANMVADRPLTGVGPGGFAYNFFDYKLRVQERHPSLFGPHGVAGDNYGEVHNDHLQVASELGLPGYLLFAAALALLASATWRRREDGGDDPERAELVRLLALPLVAGFAVLALAQFPLELVAAAQAFLWAAAAVTAWRTA